MNIVQKRQIQLTVEQVQALHYLLTHTVGNSVMPLPHGYRKELWSVIDQLVRAL